MRSRDLVEGDEHHGFVARILRAMPDIGGYESKISGRHFNFLVVDDLLALSFEIIFDGISVGVESAVNATAADLALENSKSVDIETQFWGYDSGQ